MFVLPANCFIVTGQAEQVHYTPPPWTPLATGQGEGLYLTAFSVDSSAEYVPLRVFHAPW